MERAPAKLEVSRQVAVLDVVRGIVITAVEPFIYAEGELHAK